MIDPSVDIFTERERTLLDSLPCYVFVQSGADFTFTNRLVREVLGCRDGDVLPVERVLDAPFPGLIYARVGEKTQTAESAAKPHSEAASAATPASASSPISAAAPATVHGSANLPYTTDFECHLLLPDGSSIPVRGSCRMVVAPEPRFLVAAMRIRESGAQASQSNFLEQLLNAAPEAIMITRGNRILHVNHEFENLFDYTSEEAVGKSCFDLLIPETRRHEFDMLDQAMRRYGRASMETVRLSKSGELLDVSVLLAPIELSGVEVGNFVSYRDISDKKRSEAKLQHDALHDALTSLANRALFLDRLQTTMARQQRRSEMKFAVMFLDLDRFKGINDSLGHAAGDALLVEVATRLQACFRPEDTVARLGGDEFAVLIEDVAGLSSLSGIAGRVQQEIRLPIEIYGQEIVISASIGIALGTHDHAASEQVLRDADYAMYQAKSRGHAHHEIFDGAMHVHIAHELEREQELKQALDAGDLKVWYQPIYRLHSREVEGFEALLRWQRRGSPVPVKELLATAEETGLILPIGFHVLKEVTGQIKQWQQRTPGREPEREPNREPSREPNREPWISVNLSPRQFRHPGLLDRLSDLLAQADLPARRLRLEIAECAINEDLGYAASAFERFADLGLGVILDNFGAGLASMNHLVRLPIDLVKIDQRLIAPLPAPGRHAAILRAIFDLGRQLKVWMLAEGIERREQLDALREYGCDLVQGNLLSPAVSPKDAEALLQKRLWPPEHL